MKIERVLIVGGGIAGLAVAGGLTRAGIKCVLAEQTQTWRPIGAGIILNVNATAALEMLGLAKPVRDRGFRLDAAAITDHHGRDLARTHFGALEAEFGPTLSVHRADLHAALLAGAAEAEILLDTSVEQIVQRSEKVDVRLTNGQEESFDLVIGADGIGSRVRELTFGHRATEYYGYTCWRFVVEANLEQSTMCEMWGRGKRFGVVPLNKHLFYVFAVANALRDTPDPEAGRLERLRERFSDFGGPAPTLLAALDASVPLIHNDLCAIPSGSWFDGRVVLIGDAAHAMTPNMGQGAGMALEDAAVLAELLGTSPSIPEALEAYQSRREHRVAWVQNQSRRIGQIGQIENGLARRFRNSLLRLVPNRLSTHTLRKLVSQKI